MANQNDLSSLGKLNQGDKSEAGGPSKGGRGVPDPSVSPQRKTGGPDDLKQMEAYNDRAESPNNSNTSSASANRTGQSAQQKEALKNAPEQQNRPSPSKPESDRESDKGGQKNH